MQSFVIVPILVGRIGVINVVLMNKPVTTTLLNVHQLLPAIPLWQRLPLHNDSGELLVDFMMIIPALKEKPSHVIAKVLADIQLVLTCYEKQVVFADLNLKLNVLWVSVQPIAGMCLEIAAAIHHRVPDAKLVAQKL